MTGPFTIKRRVQFAETDLAGVLHFANYYRFMEEVEHAYWRSLGLCIVEKEDGRRISWPRVATSCQYLRPVHFEDELDLALRVVRLSDRSIEYEIEFRHGGERIAVGRTTAVCCAMQAGTFASVPIPGRIRCVLEQGL